ncbi:hypothetical protein NITGR_650012 [Nitrospina gracilis 3/211]|uniref:Uncharacterized protein n=1 Tax=Nitrospina gracilis (strain 3/211) TaxID=1266370 RepID=M1YLN1_NITG3|nr:hypothetical protein NITGR_650012 [Nitrospina gracilis 3/211]
MDGWFGPGRKPGPKRVKNTFFWNAPQAFLFPPWFQPLLPKAFGNFSGKIRYLFSRFPKTNT